jgi:hypothetical protein
MTRLRRFEVARGGEKLSLVTMAGDRRFEAAWGGKVLFRFKEVVCSPAGAASAGTSSAPLGAAAFPLPLREADILLLLL